MMRRHTREVKDKKIIMRRGTVNEQRDKRLKVTFILL